jgi:tetratricopeptide (TPR) repeat protein
MLGFVEGRLDRDALAATDAHLAICGDCREVVASLARGSAPVPVPGAGVGIEGGRVGRYMLLETIGHGAMGIVHAAWDPELDRRIAIKLLRSDLGERASDQARQRLIREGRAIAKLAHPNVVAVHDVGDFEDGVFIAMEYVDGGTLASWRGGGRSPDEVISAFEQAARGIAAAHAAGLVHRDVKPSNILVGSDGRVRVVDFGLARPHGDVAAGDHAVARDPALTSSGVLVGTPLYMAPETMAGAVADKQSDQYGLAASLYEILAGVAPFAGRTLDELRRDKASRALAPPARRVPPRVLAAIRRALAPDPALRWGSLDQLADRLAAHLHRRRRRLVIAGVVAIALVAVIVPALSRHDDRCAGGADRLAGAWTAVRATAIRAAVGDRVAARFDAYARAWTDGYRRVCEATHVRGDQSEALLDIRMRCLDARRGALGALVDVLTTRSDQATRANAVAAAGSLAPITECDAIDSLAVIEQPPPALAVPIASAQHLVDEAEALDRAGQFADAMGKLGTVPRLGYRTLTARIELLRGKLEQELGDMKASERSLHEAAQAAAEARDDLVAARAWTLLVGVVGFLDGRPAEGLALARFADAAVARAGAADSVGAELASMRGLVFDGLGKFAEARAQHERALEIRERTLGRDHLEVAQVLDNLGVIPLQQERFDQAEPIYARALEIRRRQLGEDHPDVAASWNALGAAQRGLGRLADARASYDRAYAIWRHNLGDAHPNVASALLNLGNLERDLGQLDPAEQHFEAAISTWRRADPRAHAADIATAIGSLGNIAYDRKDLDRAEARLVESIAMFEGALGPDHPRIATQLENLARVKRDRGDGVASAQLLARAAKLRTAATNR